MRQQQTAKSSSSHTFAREFDPAEKAYQAMEDLLGKAAAKSWKAARDAAAASTPPAVISNDHSSSTALEQQTQVLQDQASAALPLVPSSPGSSTAAECTVVGDVTPGNSTAAVSIPSTPRIRH